MCVGMGWLRLVGSIKLQVSFAEYCLFHRGLLQKRPIILWSLLIEATQYNTQCRQTWDTGWRRLTGYLKLQVIFRKKAL